MCYYIKDNIKGEDFMDENMNSNFSDGDIVIAEQPVPANDTPDYKLSETPAQPESSGDKKQKPKKSRNDDSSTRGILIAILAVGICLLVVSVIGMIGVSLNASSPAVQQETTTANQNTDSNVIAPAETTTAQNNVSADNTTSVSPEQTTVDTNGDNSANTAVSAPQSDAEWLTFFNTAVNKLKTDGASMTKAKRTQTVDIQLSNSLAQAYVSSAKDKYLSDETVKTQIAKGDVASAKTVISPDGASYVSNLAMSDIKSISHSTDSNGNYVIKIEMPDATNPDLNSTFAKIFTFMTVDDVMDTYAPNMGATVDRSNVFLNYSNCYAQAVITPEGKVVSYYTKVNANMILKDAKISVVKTDLDATLYSDTEYTDIKW